MQCLNNSSTQFWKTKLEFPAKINYLLWMGAAAKWTKFPTFLIGYILVSGQPLENYRTDTRFFEQTFLDTIFWKEFFWWYFFDKSGDSAYFECTSS